MMSGARFVILIQPCVDICRICVYIYVNKFTNKLPVSMEATN